MERAAIRLMKDRRREMIPVEKIRVINSRTRDEGQFALNVQSIDAIRQIKDIRVNDKFLGKDGFYELICGEGGQADGFEPDHTKAHLDSNYMAAVQNPVQILPRGSGAKTGAAFRRMVPRTVARVASLLRKPRLRSLARVSAPQCYVSIMLSWR